jgi:flagellar protein FliS
MLIESAIRFGRQADEALARGDAVAASSPLMRVVDMVGELLAGVREGATDINKNLASLYWFLFRRVSEAKIHSDAAKLAEAMRLLEFERQTWLAVCERLESGGSPIGQATKPMRLNPRDATQGLSLEA